ncbi:UNVERIFIED_ORG: DUF1203 domain-containing protein [Bacillus sp. AZ43]
MTATDAPAVPLLCVPLPAALADGATGTFVDEDGGLPLRCCLRDSRPGETVALVSVTPPGPEGAYRETGPVFLHTDACTGPAGPGYPADWRRRAQVFRAYDHEGRIVGGEVVPPGTRQEEIAGRLLADPGVAFLQTRNVVHGCYMLTIRREPPATA